MDENLVDYYGNESVCQAAEIEEATDLPEEKSVASRGWIK